MCWHTGFLLISLTATYHFKFPSSCNSHSTQGLTHVKFNALSPDALLRFCLHRLALLCSTRCFQCVTGLTLPFVSHSTLSPHGLAHFCIHELALLCSARCLQCALVFSFTTPVMSHSTLSPHGLARFCPCSAAILRYLCRKHGVDWYPSDLRDQARQDEYLAWHQHNTCLHAAAVYELQVLSLRNT